MTDALASLERKGGGSAGYVISSWPLATLSVTPERMRLRIAPTGTYEFRPEDVAAIEPHGRIPLIGRGLRIVHVLGDRPQRLIFWCFGRPERLIEDIRSVGFIPRASRHEVPVRRGIPLRWSAIVGVIAIWNGLFLLDGWPDMHRPDTPGRFAILALALAFATAAFTERSSLLQRLLLRPGRRVEEIRPGLALLKLVTGVMLAVMTLSALLTKSLPK